MKRRKTNRLGYYVKGILAEHNITIKDFSEDHDIHATHLYRLFRGQDVPSLRFLIAFCKHLSSLTGEFWLDHLAKCAYCVEKDLRGDDAE